MVRLFGSAVLGATLALGWPSAVQLRAEVSQWCPPAGLTIKGKNKQGEFTRTTKGADPSDSTICTGSVVGPGAGINFGKTVRSLYGWYPLQNFAMTPETEKNARAGLSAILSGRIEEISFEMTNSQPGTSYVWSGTQTWKRTGEAVVLIGGRPTNVITLRETFKGGASSNYDGYTDVWYDPVLHMFVKSQNHGTGGPIRSESVVETVDGP